MKAEDVNWYVHTARCGYTGPGERYHVSETQPCMILYSAQPEEGPSAEGESPDLVSAA